MKGPRKISRVLVGGSLVILVALTVVGLAAAQICVESPSGLVSWWPGDGSPNDIQSSNNGGLEGGATFDVGMVGQAFKFNGANGGGSVNLGNVTAFDFTPTSSFTLDAWVKSFSLTDPLVQDTQFIISLNYQCSSTFQGLAISNTSGNAFFGVRDENGVGVFIASPSPLSLNTFHHIAGVREVTVSGKTVNLYVDGVLVATAPDPSTGPLARNTIDFIGSRSPCLDTGTFNGLIDEVEIFDRAVTATEIAAIFNAGSSGKCKMPVADAGPDQTVNEGTVVTLDGSGSKRSVSPLLTYTWMQTDGPSVTLNLTDPVHPMFTAPGVSSGGDSLTFKLIVNDGVDSAPDEVIVNVLDLNDPPACDLAQVSPALLWPPNHKLVPVTITGVSDPNNNPVTITITGVTQDEPVNGLGDGDTSPDAVIQGSTVRLRAERSGAGNGRVYEVHFSADDGQGGTCSGSAKASVPHSMKPGQSVIDDGQLYDSTQP